MPNSTNSNGKIYVVDVIGTWSPRHLGLIDRLQSDAEFKWKYGTSVQVKNLWFIDRECICFLMEAICLLICAAALCSWAAASMNDGEPLLELFSQADDPSKLLLINMPIVTA